MVTTSPGAAPLDERVEFLSRGWIATAEARLNASLGILRADLAGAELFANAESPDMYAAIDLLSDKLDRQIVRHKEKLKSHH